MLLPLLPQLQPAPDICWLWVSSPRSPAQTQQQCNMHSTLEVAITLPKAHIKLGPRVGNESTLCLKDCSCTEVASRSKSHTLHVHDTKHPHIARLTHTGSTARTTTSSTAQSLCYLPWGTSLPTPTGPCTFLSAPTWTSSPAPSQQTLWPPTQPQCHLHAFRQFCTAPWHLQGRSGGLGEGGAWWLSSQRCCYSIGWLKPDCVQRSQDDRAPGEFEICSEVTCRLLKGLDHLQHRSTPTSSCNGTQDDSGVFGVGWHGTHTQLQYPAAHHGVVVGGCGSLGTFSLQKGDIVC